MIELEKVAKIYAGRRVVDGVSLRVEAGRFCALVGTSGSGKSTTLKLVNRLVPLSEGRIRVAGEDVTTLPGEALRRRIGYAIQSVGLFPHWTVEDNIATVPRLLGWPAQRVRDRVHELLAMLHLDGAIYRSKYPHQLSGGEQQRVGVARALAADPELLLMDEPFGALDPITREALRRELRRIHQATGKTILFVTHDMAEALELADVIAIMHAGRLVQVASPADLLEHPAEGFVRDFIGRDDRGLKLLSLRRTAERMRPGEAAPGEPIDPDLSLAAALSEMVLRRAERLPVRDAAGAVAGSLRLSDILG
jgi:osmoprotectant transport system ATP-binding protein